MLSEQKRKRAAKTGAERGSKGKTWVDGPEEIFNKDQNNAEYRKIKDDAFANAKAQRDKPQRDC